MLYIGNSNKDYYLKYGATESQLFFTPYAVDNKIYKFTNQEKEEISERLIKENNIDEEAIIILFVGKFIDRKNPLLLLEAFYEVIRQQPQNKFVLLYVGTGPDLELIENMEDVLGFRALPTPMEICSFTFKFASKL